MAADDKRLVIVGAGALGCSVLPLVAGWGRPLVLVDDDEVSLSNLQRQLLFRTDDVGRPKVQVAAARVEAMFPGVRIETHATRIDETNALDLVRGAALVLDGSDNFATRFLVNDACVLAGTPLVHGAILRFTGQVLAWAPGAGGCYRCLFEAPPPEGSVPSCAEAGVLGALCGRVGAWMAQAVQGILAGQTPPSGLLIHDAWQGTTRRVGLQPDPGCAVCGDAPDIRHLDPANYQPASCAA